LEEVTALGNILPVSKGKGLLSSFLILERGVGEERINDVLK
jgi:hypothetical protein